MKLYKNFTLEELIVSSTARAKHIDNKPNSIELENLKKLANNILEPIREKWGQPIKIKSGFRSTALNNAIKGSSKTSQHMKGEAADIKTIIPGQNHQLFNIIKRMIENKEITVGQLIWEKGTKTEPQWIHVSLPYSKVNNILYL